MQKREVLYLLAVGQYRAGEYARSRRLVDQALQVRFIPLMRLCFPHLFIIIQESNWYLEMFVASVFLENELCCSEFTCYGVIAPTQAVCRLFELPWDGNGLIALY